MKGAMSLEKKVAEETCTFVRNNYTGLELRIAVFLVIEKELDLSMNFVFDSAYSTPDLGS